MATKRGSPIAITLLLAATMLVGTLATAGANVIFTADLESSAFEINTLILVITVAIVAAAIVFAATYVILKRKSVNIYIDKKRKSG